MPVSPGNGPKEVPTGQLMAAFRRFHQMATPLELDVGPSHPGLSATTQRGIGRMAPTIRGRSKTVGSMWSIAKAGYGSGNTTRKTGRNLTK